MTVFLKFLFPSDKSRCLPFCRFILCFIGTGQFVARGPFRVIRSGYYHHSNQNEGSLLTEVLECAVRKSISRQNNLYSIDAPLYHVVLKFNRFGTSPSFLRKYWGLTSTNNKQMKYLSNKNCLFYLLCLFHCKYFWGGVAMSERLLNTKLAGGDRNRTNHIFNQILRFFCLLPAALCLTQTKEPSLITWDNR